MFSFFLTHPHPSQTAAALFAAKKLTWDNLCFGAGAECCQRFGNRGECSHHNSFPHYLSRTWDIFNPPWGVCNIDPCCCMVNMNRSEAKKRALPLQPLEVSWSGLTHENTNIPSLIIIPHADLINQASALNPARAGSRRRAVNRHQLLQTKGIRRNNPVHPLWSFKLGCIGICGWMHLHTPTHTD